jgi:hypothetical protein
VGKPGTLNVRRRRDGHPHKPVTDDDPVGGDVAEEDAGDDAIRLRVDPQDRSAGLATVSLPVDGAPPPLTPV